MSACDMACESEDHQRSHPEAALEKTGAERYRAASSRAANPLSALSVETCNVDEGTCLEDRLLFECGLRCVRFCRTGCAVDQGEIKIARLARFI